MTSKARACAAVVVGGDVDMGWESRTFKVHVSLDRHGGNCEAEADRLWEELKDELRQVVNKDKYEVLFPDFS